MTTQQKPQTLEELIEEFRNRFENHIDPAEYGADWEMKDIEAFIKKVYEAGGEVEREKLCRDALLDGSPNYLPSWGMSGNGRCKTCGGLIDTYPYDRLYCNGNICLSKSK